MGSPQALEELEKPARPLTILYQSEHLVAINKPAGLLVHRSALDRHEHRNALRMLKEQTGHYLYPVHRLDKPTSGVLVFALSKEAASDLSFQFENGLVQKTYIAIVRGHCEKIGTINHAVRDRDAKYKTGKSKQAVDAITHYSTLATIELPYHVDRYPTSRYSLLQVRPVTGRRHQIRLHLKHISHPIIGDTNYGKTSHNRFFASHYHSRRLLLHACSLTLTVPGAQQPITINAPVDDEFFVRILNDQSWQWEKDHTANNLLHPRQTALDT